MSTNKNDKDVADVAEKLESMMPTTGSTAVDELEEEVPAKASQLIESTQEVVVTLADPTASLFSAAAFEDLQLSPELLKGVYAMGFQKPSKIQGKALPLLMAKPFRNFIGQSQSGTGKTGAFVLAALSRIDATVRQPQVIILAPTRELAHQILGVVKQMSQFTGITSTEALKDSVPRGQTVSDHVIVGTPGTVQDLLRRRAIPADKVGMFIIDEADVMLDRQGMGDQTIRIKQMLPPSCQHVLFSATYKEEVKMFAERVVPNANRISLKREELSVDAIKQLYMDCPNLDAKYEVLCSIYGLLNIGQSIIFCHRRDTADKVAERLQKDGHQCVVIHGGQEPGERDRVFNLYRTGEAKVLITTNVMARGIDVLDVNLVINYDMPTDARGIPDYETYLHRIGRTGRFGRRGVSINFVHDAKSLHQLQDIENYFGRKVTRVGTEDLATLEKELKDALKR